jgi:hypothetical protein
MNARPDLELRRPDAVDYIHFSQYGVLVAAATFYAVLYGDPTDVPLPPALAGLDEANAQELREIAWATVSGIGSAAP